MITTFKIFEELKPELGDYVICYENSKSITNFLNNNIGIIVEHDKIRMYEYLIKYENVPYELKDWFSDEDDRDFTNCRRMGKYEIAHFSKYKEELEEILVTNKYNI